MSLDRRVLPFAILVVLLLGFVLVAGCAPAEEEAPVAEEAPPAEEPAVEPEVDMSPRVFLAEPAEGEEVTSPVHLVFGIENFTIEPRVEGEVNEGAGHHHVGINAHCLDPGIIIPSAEPWVHFGDGSNTIDIQLPAGTHHISLQVGDGDHRTLDEPGLCFMTDIIVVEAAEG